MQSSRAPLIAGEGGGGAERIGERTIEREGLFHSFLSITQLFLSPSLSLSLSLSYLLSQNNIDFVKVSADTGGGGGGRGKRQAGREGEWTRAH